LILGEGRYRPKGLANVFNLIFGAFLMELVWIIEAYHFSKKFSVTDKKVRSLVKKYTNPRR